MFFAKQFDLKVTNCRNSFEYYVYIIEGVGLISPSNMGSFVENFVAYSVYPDRDATRFGNMHSNLDRGAYGLSPSLRGDAKNGSLSIELDILKSIISNPELKDRLDTSLAERITGLEKQSFRTEELSELKGENSDIKTRLKLQQTSNIEVNKLKTGFREKSDELQNEIKRLETNLGECNSALNNEQAKLSERGNEIEILNAKINESEKLILMLRTRDVPLEEQQKQIKDLEQEQISQKKKKEEKELKAELSEYEKESALRKLRLDQYIDDQKKEAESQEKDPQTKTNAQTILIKLVDFLNTEANDLEETITGKKNEQVQTGLRSEVVDIRKKVQTLQSKISAIKDPEKGAMGFAERRQMILNAWKKFLTTAKGIPNLQKFENEIFLEGFKGALPTPTLPGTAKTSVFAKDKWSGAKTLLIPILDSRQAKMKDDTRNLIVGGSIKTERPIATVVSDFTRTIKALLDHKSPNSVVTSTKKGRTILNDIFRLEIALERIFEGLDDPEVLNNTYFDDAFWGQIGDLSSKLKLDPKIITADFDTHILEPVTEELDLTE